MSFFDENEDPMQSTGYLWRNQATGIEHMPGPVVGIVLSCRYADDADNAWFSFLADSNMQTQQRSSFLDCSVYVVFGAVQMSVRFPHCMVAQERCSKGGPTEDEPADWSEDVPRGCTAEELREFFADGGSAGIESLSGDWVVIEFIGGVKDLPIITKWIPHPFQTANTAQRADGRRWRIRRNNSELVIEQDGRVVVSHRTGQYLQFDGQTITLKHISGAMLHMAEDGAVQILAGNGTCLLLNERGMIVNNGKAIIQATEENISLGATTGRVSVTAPRVNLQAGSVHAGTTGGRMVAWEDAAYAASACVQALATILPVLKTTAAALPGGIGEALALAIEAAMRLPIGATGKTVGSFLSINPDPTSEYVRAITPEINYVAKVLSSD